MDKISWLWELDGRLWSILDQFGIITGLLTFIFSIAILIRVRKQTNYLKNQAALTPDIDFTESYEYHSKINSENPKALCICLLDTTDSIKSDVSRFLSATERKITNENIYEVNFDGLANSADSIATYLQRLRSIRRGELSDATEVHLFFAGPMQAAILAGAVFDNWKPVVIYNKNRAGTYEYWGPLVKR